jgi:hypothetical protein
MHAAFGLATPPTVSAVLVLGLPQAAGACYPLAGIVHEAVAAGVAERRHRMFRLTWRRAVLFCMVRSGEQNVLLSIRMARTTLQGPQRVDTAPAREGIGEHRWNWTIS